MSTNAHVITLHVIKHVGYVWHDVNSDVICSV